MKRPMTKGIAFGSVCHGISSREISRIIFTVSFGLLLVPASGRRTLYATNASITPGPLPMPPPISTSDPACFPLIYKSFQSCPTCASSNCPKQADEVTAQCCGFARQLNDMYCFCDGTLLNSIQFANLSLEYLNTTLTQLCMISNLRLQSITQDRCDNRGQPQAPSPAPFSGTDVQAEGSGHKSSQSTGIMAGAVGGGAFLVVALSLVIFALWKQRSRPRPSSSRLHKPASSHLQSKPWFPLFGAAGSVPNLSSISGPMSFRLQLLAAATQNFSEKNILGKGGYGTVYKGTLPDGQVVAIKKLDRKSAQDGTELLAEVKILGTVYNRHLVRLLGYCFQGGMELLVFDYMENGSVQDALFGETVLTWPQRRNILVGTARGLMYLHDQCEQRIIHRDIKPANILLDSDWQPRLADFGLAKESLFSNTHVTTAVKGTPGFVAPELWLQLLVTPATDVFSFGMVILVVISGKSPAFDLRSEPECLSPGLTHAALFLAERSRLLELVDERMGGAFNRDEVLRFLVVGLHCVHMEPHMRPTMELAVSMLTGVAEIPPLSFAVVTYKQGPPIASSIGWGDGGSSRNTTSSNLDSTDVTGGLSTV